MKAFINVFLNRLSWGQFLISKIQFIFTLVILLKVFDVKPMAYIIFGFVALVFTYFIGYLFDKYMKEDYHAKYYGNYKFKTK